MWAEKKSGALILTSLLDDLIVNMATDPLAGYVELSEAGAEQRGLGCSAHGGACRSLVVTTKTGLPLLFRFKAPAFFGGV